ncbi:MAG: HAD family hydrolase [Puniceicoccales bacterium]|jgi:putative hydrolase of the HAD superfamily|nr:HAD family hydrolase [Puniceicoccales bacterium]
MAASKIILALSHPLEEVPTGVRPKLKKLSGVRAVIFDIYGTLLISNVGSNSMSDTSVENDEAIREALIASDFEVLEPEVKLSEQYVECIRVHYDIRRSEGILYPEINIGDVWQDYLNELFTQGVIDGDLTERSIKRVILNHEFRVNPVWPRKGTLEFLRSLQDNDICSGIISTAQFYTKLALETLYQNSLDTLGFKKQICVWSFEHWHVKPSDVLFEACIAGLNNLGIEPSEVLYVGNDMRNDIVPAHKFGFKTALFAGDKKSYNVTSTGGDTNACKPMVTFTEFSQLQNCIP